jgi:hemolysin III
LLSEGTEGTSFSPAEERWHAATHGLGVAFSVVGLILLILRAVANGGPVDVLVSVIFGTSLIAMYAASTLYHCVKEPERKRRLRVVDHVAIYLLIAGTYTPFTLITLRGSWGWSLFTVIWTLAACGVVFKLFFTGRFEVLSVAVYVAMGWCVVVATKPLVEALGRGGLELLVAGGLSYTVGVAFYVWSRLKYHHAIWHAFVLAGSVLHYLAVLLYVLPPA